MNLIKMVIATFILSMLMGCATAAKSEKMTYSGRIPGRFHKALLDSVGVFEVTGGGVTKAIGRSKIESEEFKVALIESLKVHGLFSDTGRFKLSSRIVKVTDPPGHFDLKVAMRVQYALVDSVTDKVVFKETIESDHTATVSDALIAINRLRCANEGAAKRSIALFLVELSNLWD